MNTAYFSDYERVESTIVLLPKRQNVLSKILPAHRIYVYENVILLFYIDSKLTLSLKTASCEIIITLNGFCEL